MSTDQHIDQIPWETQSEDGQVLLSPAWEVFVLAVSILSVFNLFLGWVLNNPDILQVVVIMDSILTVVFLSDLIRRLVVAENNRRYLIQGKGWIDLLSTFPLLRIFRLFRILRAMRMLQRFGGVNVAFRAFFSNKATGGLLTVILIAILVMEFGSLAILAVERGVPGANIENADDAIWYLLVTMSTVGYGDQFPVTSVGRLIGGFIIVVGVGVFGTLTGFLANAFLTPSQAIEAAAPPLMQEPPADGPGESSDEEVGTEPVG